MYINLYCLWQQYGPHSEWPPPQFRPEIVPDTRQPPPTKSSCEATIFWRFHPSFSLSFYLAFSTSLFPKICHTRDVTRKRGENHINESKKSKISIIPKKCVQFFSSNTRGNKSNDAELLKKGRRNTNRGQTRHEQKIRSYPRNSLSREHHNMAENPPSLPVETRSKKWSTSYPKYFLRFRNMGQCLSNWE